MQAFERYLARWRSAGLIDETMESSIRAYERAQTAPSGRRWQVILALILGGVLLGAGLFLFAAAHWDDASPAWRLTMVLAMLAMFHCVGIGVRERFPSFATTMHALGTIAAGAAIALVGQIFNMQEHWPAAVMLWAFSALAGWWLLKDQFQQTLALLLVPAWLISEWEFRASVYRGSEVYLARMIAVIAAAYLTGFLHSQKRVVFGILFGVSGLVLYICVGALSGGWDFSYGHDWGFLPWPLRLAAFAVLLLSKAWGWYVGKESAIVVGAVAIMVFVLPWAQKVVADGQTWRHSEPSVAAYALVAATSVFLAWWGVRQESKAMVNYAVAGFALTVMWFYFSSIMDKLGRSLGLITLGILFLAGGWMLEKMRRKLVSNIPEVAS